MNEIVVATMGDPRLPSTSSGTTARVIKSLEVSGVNVHGVDLKTISPAYKAYYILRYELRRANPVASIKLLRTPAKSDYQWSRPARLHCAQNLKRDVERLGTRKVLHMFLPGLPLAGQWQDNTEHYLLTDTTLHCQFQSLSADTVRYPKAFVTEAMDIEREMFSRVKHFFPLGQYQKKDLIEHYKIDPARITVVGTGPGGLKPYFGEKDYSQGHILFSAKIRYEEKGGPLLVEAFKLARQKRPSLELKIVGQEHYREMIGDVPGLTVYGHISYPELESLFHRAALFAMPAIWEPWGLVYLEALAARAPLLGLNRNAVPEFTDYGRFGFLVDEATPEAIAAGLLEAFDNPGRLRRMGEEGQTHVAETYKWEFVGDRIAEVLFPRVTSS